MNLATPLAWNDDVLLIPVGDLPDEMRSQIDCGPDDFALSRPQARTGSKILDSASAELVGRFREPRTLVEAVILFGRGRGLDPDQVLEGAFPLISGLVQSGFLVPASGDREGAKAAGDGKAAAGAGRGLRSRWRPGDPLLDARVERVLQVLEDTEVYLLGRAGGPVSVLKVERRGASGERSKGLLARLEREATFLAHLGIGSGSAWPGSGTEGSIPIAPRLRRLGEIEGLAYLEMEHVPGLDALAAGAEWRGRGPEGRRRLLDLGRAIAAVYETLHSRGVLHGDVHPSNVRVDGAGRVRLIDFGLASARDRDGASLPVTRERGGIPFFYEPELARAYGERRSAPKASAAGEQHAVAALLYGLVAGAHPRDYSLGREEMLRELAEAEPLPFRQRGAAPWPGLEAVLRRALAKAPHERYPSMAAFAAALAEVEVETGSPTHPYRVAEASPALQRLVERTLAAAAVDGPWLRDGIDRAPFASVNYGAAGLGLGLLQMALVYDGSPLLPLADLWTRRAARGIGRDEGFYNPDIEIAREVVGESSPYHSPSGVHAVAALVARASGDPFGHAAAIGRYLEAAEKPANGLDLTLGRAATLLGAALLLDTVPLPAARPKPGAVDPAALVAFGDRAVADLWRELDAKPPILEADVEYLGIAHGWAGFCYATLVWCGVAGREIPTGVEARLAELGDLAVPAGRGLQWPWTLKGEGRTSAMPGWCNGSAGHVFLWTLAHRLLGRPGYLELAAGAAFDTFDSADSYGSLCCGGAGRAYALLNLYRHTGEAAWLDRARDLAHRCAAHGKTQDDYPHSLWKGELGLAVLAADLERPERAAMPFFEPLGYRRSTLDLSDIA